MAKFFKDVVKVHTEGLLNDTLSVVERVWFTIRVQLGHAFAERGREEISTRCSPLAELVVSFDVLVSHLDERWSGAFHLLDKERVPPYCTPVLVILLLAPETFADMS